MSSSCTETFYFIHYSHSDNNVSASSLQNHWFDQTAVFSSRHRDNSAFSVLHRVIASRLYIKLSGLYVVAKAILIWLAGQLGEARQSEPLCHNWQRRLQIVYRRPWPLCLARCRAIDEAIFRHSSSQQGCCTVGLQIFFSDIKLKLADNRKDAESLVLPNLLLGPM